MTIAPNETADGWARKNELFKQQSTRELTAQELRELLTLTRAASSHLIYSNMKGG